ncbi:DNA mismatch repair endonuclease MutL [Gracilimonas mengyeensis]|uniref:DNA mismatch repair protein MutL n=1 Tax=Gracilimonas mengyeensis TaxID=1302730 RepID=A0A521FIU0_9BACT|nr:DNA mismatch repair endonuclease MutL [Gracilimonas mengyeensis]SMO96142.1 DNA mismatch repair protein MutL [Gracilimonas mengyeensis]
MSETRINDSIIHQLPPEISNKIAAGEVIQRPASVVKELLDNAIDSGADQVKILVQNAGKTLIQVSDNGCGMSKEDLPLCFERHATSKINSVDDLFRIRTLGFRGEAMASIASVSQVSVKTKRAEDDNGWEFEVWGGEEKEVKPAAVDDGTTVAVRNLFFNVPARRQFLKTDVTELRHILRTIQYASLANTDVAFYVEADGDVIYDLPIQNLKDRVTQIFGSSYKASLIEFEEETSYVKIHGFASDPKLAKKSRGEQFLFVNGRPFQHRYLTHVILSLYDAWTRNNEYPFYALFFEIDPSKVDVNVHPSKMEVKFEDERSVIQLARSVVNRALNQHFQVPNIQQEEDAFLSDDSSKGFDSGFSFNRPKPSSQSSGGFQIPSRINNKNTMPQGRGSEFGEQLYGRSSGSSGQGSSQQQTFQPDEDSSKPKEKVAQDKGFWQLHNTYILTQTRTGLTVIDQHLAHKRIIFEKAINATEEALPSTQQLLFAQTLELSASDYALLKELHSIIQRMGFSVQLLSGNTAMINGVPADIEIGNEEEVLVSMLHQYQDLGQKVKLEARDKLAIAFASRAAIPRGKKLSEEEMEALVDQLFACEQPYLDPLKKPTISYIPLDEIEARFR